MFLPPKGKQEAFILGKKQESLELDVGRMFRKSVMNAGLWNKDSMVNNQCRISELCLRLYFMTTHETSYGQNYLS